MQDFEEVPMGYAKRNENETRWVSVPLGDRLHEELRAKAARCRVASPDVIAQAIAM